MKPIVDLMDNSINKLKKLVPKEHQLICSDCGQIIDMRDLSQVFAHEPCDGIQKNYNDVEQIPYSSSQKIGEPIIWTKDKRAIHLN
jgi:hypothetical protein